MGMVSYQTITLGKGKHDSPEGRGLRDGDRPDAGGWALIWRAHRFRSRSPVSSCFDTGAW